MALLDDNSRAGDPIDFLQDGDGDIDLSTGDLQFSSGLAGVAAAQRQNLQMCLGENFLNLADGLDYFGQILVKNPNMLLVRRLIAEQLAAAPYVVKVDRVSLSLDSATRELRATCASTTDFGAISETVSLGVS